MSLTEFLHMGGYAFYVWTSYGITLIVLVANLVAPIRHRKKLLRDFARKARREHKLKKNLEKDSGQCQS